jgi:hypothetical protein
MSRTACLASVALVCLAALPLRAEDADASAQAAGAFDSLYGADARRVRATPGAADDLALAARLSAAADEAKGQPAFRAVLLGQAADLAAGSPEGYAAALAALAALGDEHPDKAAQAAAKATDIRQKQFSAAKGDDRAAAGEALIDALEAAADVAEKAGDVSGAAALVRRAQGVARAVKSPTVAALDARLGALAAKMQAAAAVEAFKEKVAAAPADAQTRAKLVRLLLVDMDNPAEAAKFAAGLEDESLAKYVPAAARGAEAAPELACMELAEWYRGLGETAMPTARPAMFARARAYYERFLALHTAEDLQRTQAALALKKLEEASTPATSSPATPTATARTPSATAGKWVDALAQADPGKPIAGTWEKTPAGLVVKASDYARLQLPGELRGPYEVAVEFTRVSGKDSVSLFLPVGSTAGCWFMVDAYGGQTSGLYAIAADAARGSQKVVKGGSLTNGRRARLEVRVSQDGQEASIESTLNGEPFLAWRGPVSALSPGEKSPMPTMRCLGLGAYGSEVVFHSLRVRPLAAAPPAPAAPAATSAAKGKWVDALAQADMSKIIDGKWEKTPAGLAVRPMRTARMQVPAQPEESYDVAAEFTRVSGNDAAGVFLPVGPKTGCWLFVDGWGGQASGLEAISGKAALENQSTVKGPALTNGRRARLEVRVTLAGQEAAITSTLDGKPFVTWRGPVSTISPGATWLVPTTRCLGLGASASDVVFHSLRMRSQ